MSTSHNASLVRRMWELFEAREWEVARGLLHDDFAVYWPHTGERIHGADNYIAINRNYPGAWSIRILRIIESGGTVVSEVVVALAGVNSFAASFFEVENGRLRRLQEYWVDERQEAPHPWRARWVAMLGGGEHE